MRKLLMGILLVVITINACTSKTSEKMIKNTPANISVETKTNTSSSTAKANEPGGSGVVIRPKHKYLHHKKYKIK